jgi:hypothetical protein
MYWAFESARLYNNSMQENKREGSNGRQGKGYRRGVAIATDTRARVLIIKIGVLGLSQVQII